MTDYELVVFGTGGHAQSSYDCLTDAQRNSLAAFVSNSPREQSLYGVPVWSQLEAMSKLKKGGSSFKGFVAIGDNHVRARVAGEILKEVPAFEFINVIHESARISDFASLGKGVFAGALSSIGPHAVVHDFAIVNTLANVEHGAILGEYASLGPNSVIAGSSVVGRHAVVGMSAAVLQKVTVGEHALVGASALIVSDVPSRAVFFGQKATFRRERCEGENYL